MKQDWQKQPKRKLISFRKNISKILRPSENKVCNCLNPKGIKLLTTLRADLSHLLDINLSTIFRKLLINLICSCGDDIKNYSHYPIYCSYYLQGRAAFLNTVKCIAPNILDLNNFQLTEIIVYDKGNLDNITNTSILDANFRCFFWK